MRICRFGDDRMGIIANGLVHDVTAIQQEIRTATPYAVTGARAATVLNWQP
jgi:hypothetical protein